MTSMQFPTNLPEGIQNAKHMVQGESKCLHPADRPEYFRAVARFSEDAAKAAETRNDRDGVPERTS